MMPTSRRTAVLAGVVALTLLAAIVTLSAVATPARRGYVALEEEIPVDGEKAPAFTEEVNAGDAIEAPEEVPPAESEAVVPEEAAVAEEPAAVDETEETDPHMQYAMLHPVYTRCAKKADMHNFVELITRSCGDIHELQTCSQPCAAAMRQYSSKVGCCWETVMDAYKTLDPTAEVAWRHWQGTLSGKCGITFEDATCGDAMGEHSYQALESRVKELAEEAEQNEEYINDLYYQHYFSGSAANDEDYDYYKNGGANGENAVAPNLKAPQSEEGEAPVEEKHYLLADKHPLGDEVFDLPQMGGHDDGDVHVPSEHVQPYSFSRQQSERSISAQLKAPRFNQLANAYDDYRNYQNSLRLSEAYHTIAHQGRDAAEKNPFFQWPGEAWTKKAVAQQQLAQKEGFPLAQGVVEGALGNSGYGLGVMAQAATDPINGHSLISDDASDEGRYRLTDEAAVRESKYEREFHREGDTVPLKWLDQSRDPAAGPGNDAGRYKLGELGVRI